MEQFTIISESRNTLKINFNSKQLCDAVGRVEFCSKILYQLKPNANGVWKITNSPRIDANIVGFPDAITWSRVNDLTLAGKSSANFKKEYITELKNSLLGIQGIKVNEFTPTQYYFSIKDNKKNKIYTYEFDSRSRALVAFCVLWDGENHPRDHLEVTRDPSVVYLAEYPFTNVLTKTYGDPSKTIDELRNQGFPRSTDQSPRGVALEITRLLKYNTVQEHYKLINKIQSLSDRVGRSQIPDKYKRLLYKESNYVCNNCGQQYPFEYLAPDHRVPSIVKSDNLSPSNFMKVLQTLCVRCNQVKREACKKCPYNHQCDKCAWAYPEKLGISKTSHDLLKNKSTKLGISINDFIKKVTQ